MFFWYKLGAVYFMRKFFGGGFEDSRKIDGRVSIILMISVVQIVVVGSFWLV